MRPTNDFHINIMANLVTEPACYKNPAQPSCIDLLITNNRNYFMNMKTQIHKFILAVIKSQYTKLKPKVICYRDIKNFDNNRFIYDLKLSLYMSPLVNSDYNKFEKIMLKCIDSNTDL